MKRASVILIIRLATCLLLAILLPFTVAWAEPTTPEQAAKVVQNWLGLNAQPLGISMGRQVKHVQTFASQNGAPAYYVVYLNPAGLVFLPADDQVEPIIGFMSEGYYDPSPANPLGALVSRDIPGRVLQARQAEAQGLEALAPESPQAAAQRKWAWLADAATGQEVLAPALPSISGERVAPFVQTQWNQYGAAGIPQTPWCYNYFTPNHWYCGSIATQMAQLMRYHGHPLSGIGKNLKPYYISGAPTSGYTRGGDDNGGSYLWNIMPYTTNADTPDDQRAAIGRLTWDAGLSVGLNYTAGGASSDTLAAASALTSTFQYTNAIRGYDNDNNLPEAPRNQMVNANLHAKYPVLLGICYDDGIQHTNTHTLICDGYGYDSGAMYHHLNFGWSGSYDGWYNLPNITAGYTFNSVWKCVYNIYPSGTGEIIAGRVMSYGKVPVPLAGAKVTATAGGQTYNARELTSDRGIYAIPQVPSNTTFTVNVSLGGYTFTPQQVTTGASTDNTTNTGNRWGIDFAGTALPPITLNQALDNQQLSFATGGHANWFGQNTTWHYGGSAAQSGAILDGQTSWLQTTVQGPGIMTFYWKISTQMSYDWFNWYLDGVKLEGWSGEGTWYRDGIKVPAGTHTIKWAYVKNASGSGGSDTVWLDKVVFSRNLAPIYELLLLE